MRECAAAGSASAQTLFDELLACLRSFECEDPDCLELFCSVEATACDGDQPSDDTPMADSPATGAATLPAGLIGEWATSDGSTAYQFEADGSYEYTFHYASSLACITYLSRNITEVGTVTVNGGTLTTTGSSRTTKTQQCNFSSSVDEDHGETQSYRYTLSTSSLTLTDSDNATLSLARQ